MNRKTMIKCEKCGGKPWVFPWEGVKALNYGVRCKCGNISVDNHSPWAQIAIWRWNVHNAHMATWTATLDTECPKCGEEFDMLNQDDDFWDGKSGLEIAQTETAASEGIEAQCPKCNHEFEVDCAW